MEFRNIYIVYTLILIFLAQFCTPTLANGKTSYVHDACSVTRYPNICIQTLAPYTNKAKRSAIKWARAGISVSISEAKDTCQFLIGLKKKQSMRGRNKIALLDCIECFEDSVYHLHNSLKVIRKLNKQDFFKQIDDVNTWVSTALTNEDTCLDGFGDRVGKEINYVCNKVTNMSYITSNALALVTKLANSGPQSLNS